MAEVTSAAAERLGDGKGGGVGKIFFTLKKRIALRLAVYGLRYARSAKKRLFLLLNKNSLFFNIQAKRMP